MDNNCFCAFINIFLSAFFIKNNFFYVHNLINKQIQEKTMPIKDKNKTLIKFRSDNYGSLKDFLNDIFYKDENLSKPAYELMRLVYDRKESGLQAKNWKSYIASLFNAESLSSEENEFLARIIEKYSISTSNRGAKPYESLLDLGKEKKIELADAEKQILEKILKWNSCISSYYSILNKLKAIGLIEKKSGRYHKSTAIFDRFRQIQGFISQFETDIRS